MGIEQETEQPTSVERAVRNDLSLTARDRALLLALLDRMRADADS